MSWRKLASLYRGGLVFALAALRPLGQPAAAADAAGRPLPGNPALIQNADGRLEVFRIDARGELFHKWQETTNGEWSPWVSLGGWFYPDAAVGRNADGRLEVAAVDKYSREVRHKWEVAAPRPGADWSIWSTLGGGTFSPPVVLAENGDGRLEAFATDYRSRSLKHIWQTATNGSWSGWADLQACLEPGFCVGQNKNGALEVFGVDAATKTVVHRRQVLLGNAFDWTPWNDLGGDVAPSLAVGRNSDGRLEVFGVSPKDGSVEHIFQTVADANLDTQWSAWQSLHGNFGPGLALGARLDGALEVFAVNPRDATLWRSYQTQPNSQHWMLWENVGGSVAPFPAVGRNQDGNLEVFAANAQNPVRLNHRRQISGNSGWLPWRDMDKPTFQYASRIWQTGDGLPDDEVRGMAQTPDGYLWVGTSGGLARFDGIHFSTFDSRNTPEIKSSAISALCVDHAGVLWIGTAGGLASLDGRTFTRYGTNDGLAGNEITSLCEDRSGSLWVGTLSGLSQYRGGKFSRWTQGDGLLSGAVRSLCADRDGNLWIATAGGLNCLHEGMLDCYTATNGLPGNAVRVVYQDQGGRIWAGLDNGIAWFGGGKFFSYGTQSGLSDRFVNAICSDRNETLWVGTGSGLDRFVAGGFRDEMNSEGMPYDQINAIFEDREGNLWVGSKEGLIRLTEKQFFAYTKKQGLTHNNVMTVMQDDNGSFWFGTWGGGLDRMWGDQATAFHPPGDFAGDLILSSCRARDGSLWFGAGNGGGVTWFYREQHRAYSWKDGLINAGVKVIYEDQAGAFWFGTGEGLSRLKNGAFTTFSRRDGLGSDHIQAICQQANGTLWVGTDNGLSRWENGRFANLGQADGLSDSSILAIYEDWDANLWLGTANGGLNRLRAGRFSGCTTKDGLYSDEIFEILEDDYGYLWMSCSRGVFRVKKSELDAFNDRRIGAVTSIAYGRIDGLESARCNGAGKPAAWKARDGKLWFATAKGVVAVNPDIPLQETPPPVYVERVVANGKPIETGAPLRLRHGRGELEFDYAALNFQTPEKTRYKYQLEPVDKDWEDAGIRRTAHYNNILPGRYSFHVIACNGDGVWNPAGALLSVELLPNFWETWWFRSLLVLAGIGLVGGTARYLTKARMQRKLESLKQQHAVERERGRIAKDIHDDLGSSLTRIMMLGERAQEDLADAQAVGVHTGKIVASARDAVQALDEIVWAVNPENDTIEGLIAYLSQYASQFFENTNVSCRLAMPVALPSISLPAELRHGLFLIVKEALNNILKHSRASALRVQVSQTEGILEIVIEDNGCGFTPQERLNGRQGHGVPNMARRMEELGGTFSIVSHPGEGTTVKLCLNLENLKTNGHHSAHGARRAAPG